MVSYEYIFHLTFINIKLFNKKDAFSSGRFFKLARSHHRYIITLLKALANEGGFSISPRPHKKSQQGNNDDKWSSKLQNRADQVTDA